MILCRVLGNAVATVKHPAFEGQTVLVVQPVQADGRTPKGRSFLAQDAVQAGEGDLVLCAREGNTARQILGKDTDPLHSVILGVVDEVIAEPMGGAHYNPEAAAAALKTSVARHLGELRGIELPQLLDSRYERYRKLGVFEEIGSAR